MAPQEMTVGSVRAIRRKRKKNHTVSDVLGRDGVEKLGPHGNAQVCEIAQKLPGDAETLVDFKRAINVRVVDEAFPADGCPGFLGICQTTGGQGEWKELPH